MKRPSWFRTRRRESDYRRLWLLCDVMRVDDALGAEDDCCDNDDEDESTKQAKTAISVLRNRLRPEV